MAGGHGFDAASIRLGSWNETVIIADLIIVDDHQAAAGIDRHAAPVDSTQIAGPGEGIMISRQRRHVGIETRLLETKTAERLVDRRQSRHALFSWARGAKAG